MSETKIYKVISSPHTSPLTGYNAMARIMITRPIGTHGMFCVPIGLELIATSPPPMENSFARMSIVCPDPTVNDMKLGSPLTYDIYTSRDSAETILDQPLVRYETASITRNTGGDTWRAYFDLNNMSSCGGVCTPITGPAYYQYYPYIIRIYAPYNFRASINVQFSP